MKTEFVSDYTIRLSEPDNELEEKRLQHLLYILSGNNMSIKLTHPSITADDKIVSLELYFD